MSLSKISTELDFQIAGFLEDTQDLRSLSRVSKYYQVVGEQELYEFISICRMDWVRLR
jgi:hypothetical protein